MTALPDYYEALLVSPNADVEIITATYRKLALKWHPDRNPGDSSAYDRMRLINEAYAVLSDPTKRNEYDLQRSLSNPFVGVKNHSCRPNTQMPRVPLVLLPEPHSGPVQNQNPTLSRPV